MKIAVIGTGYVGLVSGAGLAELGHRVYCVDVDLAKLKRLQQGEMPIFEHGLEELVSKHASANRLIFTSSYQEAMQDAQVVMIAVGTPPNADGSANMVYIEQACTSMRAWLQEGMLVVIKSTVPVGTNDRVYEILKQDASVSFDVASNPEMLREGVAVNDFLRPSRIIFGTRSPEATRILQELYAAIDCPKLVMSPRSSELVKYANNAFLAMKISFTNEMAHLAESLGANIDDVAIGIGTDPRIGKAFLGAGPGWGGSCFPKDVKALTQLAKGKGERLSLCEAALSANQAARSWVIERMRFRLGSLEGKKVGVFGLSFKQNTDDTRDSPALDLIQLLLKEGAEVTAYDPEAVLSSPSSMGFTRAENMYEVALGADAVLIATEWDVFRTLEPKILKQKMKGTLVMDARHLLDPARVRGAGLVYQGIGRNDGS